MNSLRYVFIIIFVFLISFFEGDNVLALFSIKKKSFTKAITFGFTFLIAFFELISLPFVYNNFAFSKLMWIYSIFLILSVIVFAFRQFKYGFFINEYEFNLKKYKTKVTMAVAIILVLFSAISSSYLDHTNADDGYFVTISTIACQNDKVTYDEHLVYDGSLSLKGAAMRPQIATWELFVAYLAKLSNIHPAIVAHSILPFVLIVLCFMAIWNFGIQLVGYDKAPLFILIYALLALFDAVNTDSQGTFMIMLVWQGKSMLANFSIPMLMSGVLSMYSEDSKWKQAIWNLIIVIAGINFSAVGLYLMSITYLVTGLPYLVLQAVKKNWKTIVDILVKVICTMLPIVLISFVLYFQVTTSSTGSDYVTTLPKSWLSIFYKGIGSGPYLIVLILCFVHIFMKETDILKKCFFIGVPVTLFATFLNPLLNKFVAQNITGVDLYWRLYWILPTYLIISYVVSNLLYEYVVKKETVSLLLSSAIIMSSGTYFYSPRSGVFYEHTNAYKINVNALAAADKISKDTKGEPTIAIFPERLSYCIRQYNANIDVVRARNFSKNSRVVYKNKSFKWLYKEIYEKNNINSNKVISMLKFLKVKYIYLSEIELNSPEYENTKGPIKTNKYKLIHTRKSGYLYKIKY
jgi:hypothetical protein